MSQAEDEDLPEAIGHDHPAFDAIMKASCDIGNRIFRLLGREGIPPSREVALGMLMNAAAMFKQQDHSESLFLDSAGACWTHAALVPNSEHQA